MLPFANSELVKPADPIFKRVRFVGTVTVESGVPKTPFAADLASFVAYDPATLLNDPFDEDDVICAVNEPLAAIQK